MKIAAGEKRLLHHVIKSGACSSAVDDAGFDDHAGRVDRGVENLILFVKYYVIDIQKVVECLEMVAAEIMPRFAE